MSIEFPYKGLNGYKVPKDAGLSYKFKVSCAGQISIYDICRKDRMLAMQPGAVTDGGGRICGCGVSEINLPSCTSNCAHSQAVPIEACCQPIPMDACVWTSTRKQASVKAAYAGDTVTYTITFTNHASIALDQVWISDDVPAEVTVVPGSIDPTPGPDESLQTGITMGALAPGQTVTLKYDVIVNAGPSCKIVNCACARYRYIDCRGCCQYGAGGCKSSVVKRIPGDIGKIAVVKCADKNSVCRCREEIVYTLTVSNPGKTVLTDVVVYDDIPIGLCYKPGSTIRNDGKPTDENPKDGIRVGTLMPGERYSIAFILVVCTAPAWGCPVTKFVNTAVVHGCAGKTVLTAQSNPWTVTLNSSCLCQCVQSRFSICDLNRVRYCYVYYNGINCVKTNSGRILIAQFGIAVKYIDCNGENRSRFFEESFIFSAIPNEFDLDHPNLRFTDFFYKIDCCGNVTVKFEARLSSGKTD